MSHAVIEIIGRQNVATCIHARNVMIEMIKRRNRIQMAVGVIANVDIIYIPAQFVGSP
jgi:hypothetical protein